MKYSQKTLHSSPERARYGVSFVSSKGNILCRLVKIELYKIFAIINRAIKGLHCINILHTSTGIILAYQGKLLIKQLGKVSPHEVRIHFSYRQYNARAHAYRPCSTYITTGFFHWNTWCMFPLSLIMHSWISERLTTSRHHGKYTFTYPLRIVKQVWESFFSNILGA